VLMAVAYQIVVARERHGPRVVRVVHQEYAPLRESQGRVLAVIMHAVGRVLREPGQVKQIARIVAVYQVDRQPHADDRVQRRGRDQIAAMQHHPCTEGFCFRDSRGERPAVIMTVGDDTDFQTAPPPAFYPSRTKLFLWPHNLFFGCATSRAFKIGTIQGVVMFTSNPFAELSAAVPPAMMQGYVVIMIVLVAVGTLIDIVHKGSARYFFDNWRKSRSEASRQIGGAELLSIAIKTGLVDVLASGEFCNARRRVAHLLTMYGFAIYVVTTAVMVFGYPTPATPTPAMLPLLWWIGGLMVLVGGYWFWFFIRVDVAAEGNSPFRVMRADLFILSLLASVTLGLVWAYLQTTGASGAGTLFALYLVATTVLFGSVPWSKFAHMFFKPAAAFEKRVSYANGTRSRLPAPADKPERFGSAREQPRHY
jgi:hypothetical protein